MVTLVASCIHIYSFGYMHERAFRRVPTRQAPLADGQHDRNAAAAFTGSYQYLSLFCFSMLGLVISGNVAMVFVFWELVGICSYLLIGFWYERTKVGVERGEQGVHRQSGGRFRHDDRPDGPVDGHGNVLVRSDLRAGPARTATSGRCRASSARCGPVPIMKFASARRNGRRSFGGNVKSQQGAVSAAELRRENRTSWRKASATVTGS